MTTNYQTVFSVTCVTTPLANGWGYKITFRLVNPDGSTHAQESWQYGPDGLLGYQESDIADWIADETRDYLLTQGGLT